MPSVIFNSTACRQCDGKPLDRQQRRVLRTSTEDICCNCGDVLQTFPEMMSFSPGKDVIVIPDEVTETLARLLKLRLFSIGSDKYPQIVAHHPHAIEKAPAHRIGHQALIALQGPGNTWATIRWSFSRKDLLPSHPWDFNPNYHKRISLADLDFVCPTRVVRARNVLSDFDLTEGLLNDKERTRRIVRLEKRCHVAEQPFQTVPGVILVVKVQFEWLQVGSIFPDESGERLFKAVTNASYPLTLEEAIDRAVNSVLWLSGRGGVFRFDDRSVEIVRATNPCPEDPFGELPTGHQKPKYMSRLRPPRYREDFQGAFPDSDGRHLVPAGVEYFVEVEKPWECGGTVKLTISQDNKTVIDGREVGGPKWSGGYTGRDGSNLYTVDLKYQASNQAGKTLIVCAEYPDGTIDAKTYLFVPWKRYNQVWEQYRAPYIDRYKQSLCVQIADKLRSWDGRVRRKFESGAQVAALISDRWLEGTYGSASAADGPDAGNGHFVDIVGEHGPRPWHVIEVLTLEEALQAGHDVVPPFRFENQVGFQCVRLS